MDFNYWLNEVADMPMRDKDGDWFDAETGIYFNQPRPKKAKKEKVEVHPMMNLKLEQMKRDAERVVLQENYLDRTPESVREQKIELIKYAKELLSRRAKKAEFCKMYDMRTAVGRAENAARNNK